jgi:hypothetical protein
MVDAIEGVTEEDLLERRRGDDKAEAGIKDF